MGLDRRGPLGAALLRRTNTQYSCLQRARQAAVDAAKTRVATGSDHSAYGSGGARAGRFSNSDRIDPAVYGSVSRSLLGKHTLEGPRIANDRTRRPRHKLALCYLSGHSAYRSTLRYLRGPAWIGDGSCNCENTLPLLCHNRAKRNSSNSRLREYAAIDSRPDQPGEFLTLPAK